jgi:hypothetical protein
MFGQFGRGLILRYCRGIRLEGLRKTTKHSEERSPGRVLYPGSPEYKAGVLTIRPRRSVSVPLGGTSSYYENASLLGYRVV